MNDSLTIKREYAKIAMKSLLLRKEHTYYSDMRASLVRESWAIATAMYEEEQKEP